MGSGGTLRNLSSQFTTCCAVRGALAWRTHGDREIARSFSRFAPEGRPTHGVPEAMAAGTWRWHLPPQNTDCGGAPVHGWLTRI